MPCPALSARGTLGVGGVVRQARDADFIFFCVHLRASRLRTENLAGNAIVAEQFYSVVAPFATQVPQEKQFPHIRVTQ